jgi:hypothetical protein
MVWSWTYLWTNGRLCFGQHPTTTICNTNNRTHDHFYFNHYFYFYLPRLSIDEWKFNKNGDSSNINIWVCDRCLDCKSS